ncbi:hypothetical protein BKA61DRAFT_615829 [Leptodontidium sp. MPI-SDFR-AT-0119]|nr:hypothetical protein BKA61DRAFT_615829 [Leptodontidium sp. MPI-SDFR-AT-0119]
MAFYTPTPALPRIVVTEHEDNINTVHVPWKRNILAAIWIPQFFFLLLGMSLLPIEIYEVFSFQTIFICIIALGNIILMSTPLIEAHRYATGNLTPQFFHKLQAYKARWVAGSMVVVVLIQGGNEFKSASPFAAGLWYAKQMMKETGGSNDGGNDVENGSVRL